MGARTRPAHCWCGIHQIVNPCVFHGGDLEQRVSVIMSNVFVVDTHDNSDLHGAKKWLAFVLAGQSWHLLPLLRRGQCDRVMDSSTLHTAKQMGDLAVGVHEQAWDARQKLSVFEMLVLQAEAIMDRWPIRDVL